MKREKKMGLPTRDAYGQALVELGEAHPEIVVLDGDVSGSTRSRAFAKKFPERFINCGIAEANMVSAAAGMASCGKVPFVSSFAAFLMCKTFDQLRMSVVNPKLNVKFCGSHSGISLGQDGASQMAVEDIALALALPRVVILVPADEVSARALVRQAAAHTDAVYIRTSRSKSPLIYPENESFGIGQAKVLCGGNDVTVMATGLMVWEALEAADLCARQGIQLQVMDLHTIRPLDTEAIRNAARTTGAIVVAEEHLVNCGLGAQVAQVVASEHPVPMEFVGIQNTYAESGKPAELLDRYGLTARHIVSAVERVIKKKQ